MEEQPGPTIQEAKVELNGSFKTEFLNVVLQNVPAGLHDEVNRMIDDSINEGVDKAYKPYSLKGWAMFGMPDCEKAIISIYIDKLRKFKSEMKTKTHTKLSFGRNPSDMHSHIASFMGGRRKKHRKIKGKYTFKKRKSIRKKKRKSIRKKKRRTRKL